MANRICTILGIGFLLVGLAGFVAPSLLGAHLSLVHNIIHVVSGAVALWLGLKGTPGAAKTFCLVFGAVYLLLGIAGFVAGSETQPSTGIPHANDTRILKVIPGVFEVGTSDHIIHILLGGIFLLGGLMTKASPTLPLPPPK
ncbi:MAG TPA: DUF4383 domain-containing protein [Thermoanaerobaculia bacterium]|nr:DUF4383 domain-containing protein [Thermoanaerobaculia bacterium]